MILHDTTTQVEVRRRKALLERLEMVLGLYRPRLQQVERIVRYAAAAETTKKLGCRASLDADRWATADHLLRRRDAAMLVGWDGGVSRQCPAVLKDIGAIEKELAQIHTDGFDSEAERLRTVAARLTDELKWPEPPITLLDSPECWPAVWQPVLKLLPVKHVAEPAPCAATKSSLAAIQAMVGGGVRAVVADKTVTVLRSRSRQAAVQSIASMLAAEPDRLEGTVILAADASVAASLDFHLRRLGIPTGGAPAAAVAASAEQLLPLALGLCWTPVNAEILLDLVTLPVGPVPHRCGRELAEALARMPGLHSKAWDSAMAALLADKEHMDEGLHKRLDAWLDHPRVPVGQPAPASLLQQRCAAVAQWAAGRASVLNENDTLRGVLNRLAGKAAVLGGLIGASGENLKAAQVRRLLDEVGYQRSADPVLEASAGGPLFIASLADIPVGCKQVVWLGIATSDVGGSPWVPDEVQALRRAGLDVDDGERELRLQRAAERRGLRRIAERLLIMLTPEAEAQRPHPFWTCIQMGLKLGGTAVETLPAVENMIITDAKVGPWQLVGATSSIQASHSQRPEWLLGREVQLVDRDRHSYSELSQRLGCPLAWVLNYAARLWVGPVASLPEEHQLRGIFAHSVLAEVLDGPLKTPAGAAARAGTCVDARVPFDAPQYTRPDQVKQLQTLRETIIEAARSITGFLRDAGCDTAQMEKPIATTVDGWCLDGAIDCLATGPHGRTVIVDIKTGSLPAHRQDLASGRAVQLALYAATTGAANPVVAYYILNARRLLVLDPAGSIQSGAGVEVFSDAPAIRDVWHQFNSALRTSDAQWLSGKGAVPARPLQPPDDWPSGADLVLDPEKPEDLCSYCAYPALCGHAERT